MTFRQYQKCISHKRKKKLVKKRLLVNEGKKNQFKKDRKIGNILSSDIWIFDKAHLKYKTVKKKIVT